MNIKKIVHSVWASLVIVGVYACCVESCVASPPEAKPLATSACYACIDNCQPEEFCTPPEESELNTEICMVYDYEQAACLVLCE